MPVCTAAVCTTASMWWSEGDFVELIHVCANSGAPAQVTGLTWLNVLITEPPSWMLIFPFNLLTYNQFWSATRSREVNSITCTAQFLLSTRPELDATTATLFPRAKASPYPKPAFSGSSTALQTFLLQCFCFCC